MHLNAVAVDSGNFFLLLNTYLKMCFGNFFFFYLELLSFIQEMKICSAIINLFHLIPAAPQTLVKPLLEVVMKTERAMLIEVCWFLHFWLPTHW